MPTITKADARDIPALYVLYGDKPPAHFERCLDEQDQNKRVVFIAHDEGQIMGCIHLIWSPVYKVFKDQNIPEIQDVFVTPSARQNGIATALVTHCENLVKNQGQRTIGLGVALHGAYGPAQKLYHKLGYAPDGNGVVYESQTVQAGEIRSVDDYLCLKLIKSLTTD